MLAAIRCWVVYIGFGPPRTKWLLFSLIWLGHKKKKYRLSSGTRRKSFDERPIACGMLWRFHRNCHFYWSLGYSHRFTYNLPPSPSSPPSSSSSPLNTISHRCSSLFYCVLAMFTRPAYHHYVIVSAIFSVLQWQCCWFAMVNCTSTVSLSHRSHNDRTNALPDSTYATHTISATQWYSTLRSRQSTISDDKRNAKPMDALVRTAKWPVGTMVNPTLPPTTVSMAYALLGRSTLFGTVPTSAATGIISSTSTKSTIASNTITAAAHESSTSSSRQRRRKRRKMANADDVLVLVQKSNIQLNGVREQFYRLIEAFNITLANVTIDFDTIDGEYYMG